ncbi:aminotransferase class V-fold PLP-dependent enzyme [Gimesia chilikensis]|uniref:aminotransferase class V-fold PLP-dependent enzyme n=1 Tax=Gimesia chilikensis TaxID=2605989 RepID=UPI0018E092FC|nr:aminotransferase class V-fold PLP-dependent enzyme [Gimesia chilikensis]
MITSTGSLGNPAAFYCLWGGELTCVPLDNQELVDSVAVRRAIWKNMVLISIMHANNEVGTIQPNKKGAAIAGENGIPCNTEVYRRDV